MAGTATASPVILTPEGVYEKTGVAVQTLSNWRVLRNKGKTVGPPPFKIGRMVRYFEADVDAWIEEQAKAS